MSLPRLRFPEFRDAGKWEEERLGSICEMQAGKFVRASEIQDQIGQDLYPCYGGNGVRGFTKTYTHAGQYSLIGRQGALCGNINLTNGKFYATEHAVVVTPNKGVNTIWLFYNLGYLNLNQYATGQAQPGLSVDNLEKVLINIPSEEKEQQKIADCLSSIDDLIAAQAQKLAALKAHKKGLMQQLFPAEGETVPKLRFPEFLDAGEWESKKVGDICDFVVPGRNKPTEFDGDIPWITTPDIEQNGIVIFSKKKLNITKEEAKNIGSKIVPKNSIIISCVGELGVVAIAGIDLIINQQLHAFIPKESIYFRFLLYALTIRKPYMEKVATKTAVPYMNKDTCNSIPVIMPNTSEQQKIADCLSSIDDLIAAQTQKLAVLKAHKKGLMQQLFPAVDEATE